MLVSDADRISAAQQAELAQIDLYTNEVRWLVGGDEPFAADSEAAIATVVTRAGRRPIEIAPDLVADTELWLRVPSVDIDSADVLAIEVVALVGARVVLAVGSEEELDAATLRAVVGRIAVRLTDLGYGTDRFTRLGVALRDVGIDIVEQRTRSIEQKVRDALAVDELDYAALRAFPGRLAAVEHVAEILRQRTPRVRCLREKKLIATDLPPYSTLVDAAARDARDASSRLSGLLSSQQLVLAERQAVDTKRFEHVATVIGVAVLVPGLVAAIFGANVGFHGRDSSEGLYALLLFMVAGGAASYALLWSFELGLWRRVPERFAASWLGKVKPIWRFLLLVVLVGVLGAAGAVVMGMAAEPPRKPDPPRAQKRTPPERFQAHTGADPARPVSPKGARRCAHGERGQRVPKRRKQ